MASNYVTNMKPIEKMISRDVQGNLGIVPIGYQNFQNMEIQSSQLTLD